MNAALVLDQRHKLDRKRLLLSAIAAVLFHLWLFYFTFPEMTGIIYREKPPKPPVVIRRLPPREKPKIEPPKVKKKEVEKPKTIIPVPDPTPDEPEEIQELEPEPEIEEIPEDQDFIWGIPDAPDVEPGDGEERIYSPWEVSKEPELIKEVGPSYPEMARLAGKEAMVVLQLVVDANGDVISHAVLHATGDTFKEQFIKEAVAAVYRFKFDPAIQSGHPVPCQAKYTFQFKLR
ncbi:MAG: energy transducer TonB [Candidatus Coatesbacteria bacterium]|nr:energy transducer TonB [Candidatus Coatesbacteria bacterium]